PSPTRRSSDLTCRRGGGRRRGPAGPDGPTPDPRDRRKAGGYSGYPSPATTRDASGNRARRESGHATRSQESHRDHVSARRAARRALVHVRLTSPFPPRCRLRSMQAPATSPSTTEIVWHDRRYTARSIAGGAAFELYSDTQENGFQPNGRSFHRYVHASEVSSAGGELLRAGVAPVSVPVMPGADFRTVHQYSQNPRIEVAERALVAAVRATAFVTVGTRMVKPLNRQQVARQLSSAPLVSGVCFREFDVAHLRTPDDRVVLAGDPDNTPEVAYALRRRAIAPGDYVSTEAAHFPGLVSMPGRERRGSMILGTGFLPSGKHLIPEFATANLADLPLTARAEILAYTPEG